MAPTRSHKYQRRRATPSQSIPHIKHNSTESKQHRMKKQRIQRQHRQRHDSKRVHPVGSSRKTFKMPALQVCKATRDRWASQAVETQGIVLGDGKYVEERHVPVVSSSAFAQSYNQGSSTGDSLALYPHRTLSPFSGPTSIVHIGYDIFAQVQLSRQATTFYPHYSDTLATWATTPPRASSNPSRTTIELHRCSTLHAAHRLSQTDLQNPPKIGVLSFASPKKPGGGFVHGGDEQEETIARLSSLVAGLSSPAAQDFYKEHKKYRAEDGSGLHDHSMVYSPGVVVFRIDPDESSKSGSSPEGGAFVPPYSIDVVSAVPVNAAAVRTKHIILPSEEQFFEDGIRSAMKERMARVLRAFEVRGDKVLVLGAFGCGSSQNNVEAVGGIWAELLVCGDSEAAEGACKTARFKDVFDKVIFAVPGKLYEPFKRAYEMRIFEEQVIEAASSESDE